MGDYGRETTFSHNIPNRNEQKKSVPGWGLEKGKATPVFWPGEFYQLYSPWVRKESDTTERLSLHFTSTYFSGYCAGPQ